MGAPGEEWPNVEAPSAVKKREPREETGWKVLHEEFERKGRRGWKSELCRTTRNSLLERRPRRGG